MEDRFWSKVDAAGDCWLWTASVGSHGYGQFNPGAKAGRPTMVLAHRMAWTLLVGRIPQGMTLDHLCRNQRCLNPDHLELVTYRENSMRGYSPNIRASRSGVCQRGHSDWKIRPGTGRPYCHTCAIERWHIWKQRKLGKKS